MPTLKIRLMLTHQRVVRKVVVATLWLIHVTVWQLGVAYFHVASWATNRVNGSGDSHL
ncbi:MAG: hypothetical protein WD273_12300 [Trueperaceae bacterium]